MERFTFCNSLRKRPGRDNAVAAFRAAKWKEAKLNTHDAALLLPAQHSQQVPESVLRGIMISTTDLDAETCITTTWQRLERLYHQNGNGKDAVIVFVLKEDRASDTPRTSMSDMNTYMKLQSDLLAKDLVMPVVPCAAWEDVPRILLAFHRQLVVNRRPPRTEIVTAQALELLRHSATQRPLSDHSVHILTDLTTGFRDYLEQMAVPNSREKLLSYLGVEGEQALLFWLEEYTME